MVFILVNTNRKDSVSCTCIHNTQYIKAAWGDAESKYTQKEYTQLAQTQRQTCKQAHKWNLLLKFPLTVVQWADLASLEPARNTMKVKSMLQESTEKGRKEGKAVTQNKTTPDLPIIDHHIAVNPMPFQVGYT